MPTVPDIYPNESISNRIEIRLNEAYESIFNHEICLNILYISQCVQYIYIYIYIYTHTYTHFINILFFPLYVVSSNPTDQMFNIIFCLFNASAMQSVLCHASKSA